MANEHLRASIIGGVFVIIGACIGGSFLLINTVLDKSLPTANSSSVGASVIESTPQNIAAQPLLATSVPIASSTPSNLSETLNVPFSGGVLAIRTANFYSGRILIKVSGVGQASGTQMSDAFYVFSDSNDKSFSPTYTNTSLNWVLQINGMPVYKLVDKVPEYRSDHSYSFEFDVAPGQITFGVGDEVVADNSGSYVVMVSTK